MEQPPGSRDDLQPQDLSTSSIPSVIDLTGKGEECVLNAASLDALPFVKSPGWYANSASSNQGLPFSETGSPDVALQAGEPVQPDNAFSRTTVTLSYVSRSHVFSAQDSLSRRSPLCGVPPIGNFSLHPSCDSEKGPGETGFSLAQHYVEQAEGPVDLGIQPELLQSLSQAPAGPEKDGGVVSSDGYVDEWVRRRKEEVEHSRGLENGQGNSSVACAESSPETLTPATVEDPEKGTSEMLLLMSKNQDPVVVLESVAARDLCSLSREYISPLEDPVSPSATSLDYVEDVFILPQASCSPSGDNSYLEAAEEVAWDVSRTEGAIQEGSDITRLDSINENKQPVHGQKSAIEPLIDLTDDVCVSSVLEDNPKTVIPHMNGNAKAQERTLTEKKLPWRSSRGTRLDAIVMNINSSRYKVSGCIRTNKKARASPPTASVSSLAETKSKNTLPVGKRKSRATSSFSVKTIKQKAETPVKRVQTNNINTDSTSDSKLLSISKKSHSSTPPKSPQLAVHKRSREEPKDVSLPVCSPQTSPKQSTRRRSSQPSPQSAAHKNSKKETEPLSLPNPSAEIHVARSSPPPSKSPKKSPGKAKGKAAGSKTSPTAKTKAPRVAKRRRKKPMSSQSLSMFSPMEPEIKLKYVNFKEEKRELRSDSFSPFIRINRRQPSPSLCSVVNYQEEGRTQCKKGQQQQAHPGDFLSAVVPSTSCLQLGRASTHSQHQRSLVCCLCGKAANAMDLGDLHGPYYPEGYQPSTKRPASISRLKEEEDGFSDSDSSSCSGRGRRRKCAVPPTQWSFRPGGQLQQKGLLESHRLTSNGMGSPAAKRARSDSSTAEVEDWYSPPVLPLEPCEYWLHEDCGIWSAGVFLVKGKVYGLEEAVKTAQEMMCSACADPGATLGCFFKGCPNKYHYRCALESECVLLEENFSMKCKKHKDKMFKGPAGNRCNNR
ncbi:transcription factor 20 [Hippoglossus hippoglossus]|uniref:transcription factor 20 n=1 Tax=Hippoglossus hippoglossus TaxID=8267 RepID=UPI00148DFFE8|nr:transcription factor 20 [Hippoglossus hippoglossus]